MEVLLLKERKDEDSYEKVLCQNGYQVIFLPVLKFDFSSSDELSSYFKQPIKFSGIIFTSQTSVEAVSRVISHDFKEIDCWKKLPVFVVGNATKIAVRDQLGLESFGEASGNASNLSEVIIDYFHQSPSYLPLLFPCGNLRKETLPSRLHEANIALQTCVCYSTVPNPLIESKLIEMTKNIPKFIVFFSPSGVQFTFHLIKTVFSDSFQHIKLCAIGPSTGDALRETGLQDIYIAKKPTPQDLLDVFKQF